MNFSLDRDGKRDIKNLHTHMKSYFNFILMPFTVLLYGVKMLHSSTTLALRSLYFSEVSRSFQSFCRYPTPCHIYHMCCSSKLPTIVRNYLGWWVLHKCIAMALSTYSYVSSGMTFFNDVHYLFRLVHAWNIRKSECKHSHIWMTLMRFQHNSRPILTIFNEFSDIFVWV